MTDLAGDDLLASIFDERHFLGETEYFMRDSSRIPPIPVPGPGGGAVAAALVRERRVVDHRTFFEQEHHAQGRAPEDRSIFQTAHRGPGPRRRVPLEGRWIIRRERPRAAGSFEASSMPSSARGCAAGAVSHFYQAFTPACSEASKALAHRQALACAWEMLSSIRTESIPLEEERGTARSAGRRCRDTGKGCGCPGAGIVVLERAPEVRRRESRRASGCGPCQPSTTENSTPILRRLLYLRLRIRVRAGPAHLRDAHLEGNRDLPAEIVSVPLMPTVADDSVAVIESCDPSSREILDDVYLDLFILLL